MAKKNARTTLKTAPRDAYCDASYRIGHGFEVETCGRPASHGIVGVYHGEPFGSFYCPEHSSTEDDAAWLARIERQDASEAELRAHWAGLAPRDVAELALGSILTK